MIKTYYDQKVYNPPIGLEFFNNILVEIEKQLKLPY